MRDDILAAYPAIEPARVHVVHNGIDTQLYAPVGESDVLARYGVDPTRPSALFVGRITRQKGVAHLLAAAASFDPDVQLILCAGSPDTPEIGAEIEAAVARLAESRTGVIWLREMLPRPDVVALLGAATVFVCPSIYEPLGIVNLEAMACETPVVASDVGGIPEVVDTERTGLLVHYSADDDGDVRGRPRRRGERHRPRSAAGPRHGCRRAGAGGRGVRMGRHRPPNDRPVPLADLTSAVTPARAVAQPSERLDARLCTQVVA